MRARIRRIIAITATGLILAYLSTAATDPMSNYAPLPASLPAVILVSTLCGVLLVLITEKAVSSIALASMLGLFLYGGIRACVVAWSLTDLQIPFGFLELAIADSVFQFTMRQGLFLYMAIGLMGLLGASLALLIIPEQLHMRAK